MFRKVNVPIIGVVENMSNYSFKGKISGVKDFNKVNLFLENQKINIDNKGHFETSISIFSGKGGAEESERLGVPLLGKLNIDTHLSFCSDNGTPYVFEDINTHNMKQFYNISKKIID